MGMQDLHVDIAIFCIYSLYERPQVDYLINMLEFSELDCMDVQSFADQSIADSFRKTQPDVVCMLN